MYKVVSQNSNENLFWFKLTVLFCGTNNSHYISLCFKDGKYFLLVVQPFLNCILHPLLSMKMEATY
jgi:hypothetical protein